MNHIVASLCFSHCTCIQKTLLCQSTANIVFYEITLDLFLIAIHVHIDITLCCKIHLVLQLQ